MALVAATLGKNGRRLRQRYAASRRRIGLLAGVRQTEAPHPFRQSPPRPRAERVPDVGVRRVGDPDRRWPRGQRGDHALAGPRQRGPAAGKVSLSQFAGRVLRGHDRNARLPAAQRRMEGDGPGGLRQADVRPGVADPLRRRIPTASRAGGSSAKSISTTRNWRRSWGRGGTARSWARSTRTSPARRRTPARRRCRPCSAASPA